MNAEEYQVRNLISQAQTYAGKISENEAYERMSQETIDKADKLMRPKVHHIYQDFGLDTLISMAEVSIKVPQRVDLAMFYLDLFFKMKENNGQFYIRALILKATIQSLESKNKELKADENVENAKTAFKYVEEAIKLIASD